MYLKLAEASDKEAFIQLAMRFLATCPYKMFEPSVAKIDTLFDTSLDINESIIVFLMTEADEPVGMIFGKKFQPLFSDEWLASEIAWWVDDDYRNTSGSLQLIKAYQDWSIRVGVSKISMAMLPGFSPASIGRVYTKMGYKPVETTYIKEL